MRIAFVLPKLAVGGAERVTLSLMNMLAAKGHEVSVITFWSSGSLSSVVDPGVKVVSLEVKRSYQASSLLALAWKAMAPDVVLSALNTANAVCCHAKTANRLETPLICAIHARLYGDVIGLSVIRQRLWAQMTRRYISAADIITTPSDGVTAEARRFFKGADVRTMHNAVISREKSKEQPHHRDHKQILWLGRLTPPKNPQLVINAFAQYARQLDWRLQIAGDGPLRGSLVNLAAKLGVTDRVSMLGEVSDPGDLLSKAGCLVFASRSEALPTVIIEAMQCGTPVVATDTPCGVNELLLGANYGHLVPLHDPGMMADAIKRALPTNPEIPSAFLSRYEPETVCRRYEELFEEVVKKKASGV
ncbi:MAG: glycosyltransferase [Armatimonadota bacterium]